MLQISTSLFLFCFRSFPSHLADLRAFCQTLEAAVTTRNPRLPVRLLAVIRLLDGGIGRLRVNRVPGWIIRCPSVPDRHGAVTHYTGTSFGVRAGLQRICRASLINDNADLCNTQHTAGSSKTDLSLSHLPQVGFFFNSRFVATFVASIKVTGNIWKIWGKIDPEKWECFIWFNSFGLQSLAMHVSWTLSSADREEQEIEHWGGRPEPEKDPGICSTSTCASKAFIISIMVPFYCLSEIQNEWGENTFLNI